MRAGTGEAREAPGGGGRRMPLHRGVGRKRSTGRTRSGVQGGPERWGAGGGVGVGVPRRGVEGRWGVAGIVMQIVLGEASVSPERILFLAMIPRAPGEETEEGGKGVEKEKREERETPGIWLTFVSGTVRHGVPHSPHPPPHRRCSHTFPSRSAN